MKRWSLAQMYTTVLPINVLIEWSDVSSFAGNPAYTVNVYDKELKRRKNKNV